jgi:hypothetical protein
MAIEILTKSGNLLRRTDVFMSRQEGQVAARRSDCVNAGELLPETLGDPGKHRVESGVPGYPMGRGGTLGPPHNEKRLAENGGIAAGEERFGNRYASCESRL